MHESDQVRFDGWTLLKASGELLRGDQRTRLQDHPFKVLQALLERPGELATREQLIARLWPKQVVDYDTALNTAVRRLRAALGDEAETPRFIETVPRRGYRFIGHIETGPVPAAEPVPPAPPLPEPVPEPLPEPAVATAPPARRRGPRVILVAAALIGIVAGGWFWLREKPAPAAPQDPPAAAAAQNSIVVLPFVSLTADADDQLFADGLTEELINQLARNESLRVIARTSSFALQDAGLDIPQVAERVGVSHVLEGSLRRSGDRLRVTAQLIDTADSGHLWSQNYDQKMGDLFDIQDDIASQVAAALEVRLDPPAPSRRPPEPDAYEKYVVARHLFNRRGDGDVERSRELFAAAAELDPEFAEAWAGLSSATFILLTQRRIDPAEGVPSIEDAAKRALALDPRLAEPHVRLANLAFVRGDRASSREHWQLAAELDPESPYVNHYVLRRAMRNSGEVDEVELGRQIVERDPLSVVARHNLSWELLSAGHFAESLEEARRAQELSPSISRHVECLALVQLGRFEEARATAREESEPIWRLQCLALAEHGLGHAADSGAALAELERLDPESASQQIAEVHAYRGDADSAFEWLYRNREYCAREPIARAIRACIEFFDRAPLLSSLHSDPRWKKFLEDN